MQFRETVTEQHVCGHLGTTRSSSAANTVRHPRTSSWSAGIPARIALPTTPHHKTCQVMPVDQGRRAGNLTRLHPVKPCRRGRPRSQGGLTWSAGIPARIALPNPPHRKTCHAKPVNQGRRAGNLTRLHPVKPCRRGRPRSQGGLTWPAPSKCTTRTATTHGASSAANTVRHPRTSPWSAGIPARIASPATPWDTPAEARYSGDTRSYLQNS
jgi:hypothetical protein